jgi:hypothetical protein
MPGLSGWQVAERLRAGGHCDARILMISASALEAHRTPLAQPFHDGYLIKPVDLARMLTMVGQLLGLQWTYGANDGSQPVPMPPLDVMRAIPDIDELIAFGRMGHIKGLLRKLDELQNAHPEQRMIVSYLRELVDDFDLSRFMASLGAGQEHESRS